MKFSTATLTALAPAGDSNVEADLVRSCQRRPTSPKFRSSAWFKASRLYHQNSFAKRIRASKSIIQIAPNARVIKANKSEAIQDGYSLSLCLVDMATNLLLRGTQTEHCMMYVLPFAMKRHLVRGESRDPSTWSKSHQISTRPLCGCALCSNHRAHHSYTANSKIIKRIERHATATLFRMHSQP